MFTGLVEEIGTIYQIKNIGGGKKLYIQANKVLENTKIDDSISVNGACQTVVEINNNIFAVEAVEETLLKTTLGRFVSGTKVNLERAARLGDRLGGHLVQGHIDTTAKVSTVEKLRTAVNLWISYPSQFGKYIAVPGSIAINGISLTVARKESSRFMVAVIPHTWQETTLNNISQGDELNLEFDIIGKYVENMLKAPSAYTGSLDKYIEQPYL